jgi:hypothetical protein
MISRQASHEVDQEIAGRQVGVAASYLIILSGMIAF